MITITSPALCLSLPDRFQEGHALTLAEARVLNQIFASRMRNYVVSWLDKGLDPGVCQANLEGFAQTYEFTVNKPDEIGDPITCEALRIAREIVVKRLASQGLDLDSTMIDRHSAQVAALPKVRARAEEIVQIRTRAAHETLAKVCA